MKIYKANADGICRYFPSEEERKKYFAENKKELVSPGELNLSSADISKLLNVVLIRKIY